MKKRTKFLIAAGIIIIIGFMLMKFPVWHYLDAPLNWHYGGTTKELLYSGSFHDRKAVEPIMQKIDEAMSTVGKTEEELNSEFGKAAWHAISKGDYPEAVSETHTLKLLTANLGKDNGYMWVKYSQEAYNVNHQRVCGSWDIETRLTLAKDDNGEWDITDIGEAP